MLESIGIVRGAVSLMRPILTGAGSAFCAAAMDAEASESAAVRAKAATSEGTAWEGFRMSEEPLALRAAIPTARAINAKSGKKRIKRTLEFGEIGPFTWPCFEAFERICALIWSRVAGDRAPARQKGHGPEYPAPWP